MKINLYLKMYVNDDSMILSMPAILHNFDRDKSKNKWQVHGSACLQLYILSGV